MALDPTPQDKRGIVLKNSDGSFDYDYPAGDKPAGGGSAPSAITDLAIASVGSTSASLSWTLPANTDNVEIYQRDVTASGSFSLIDTVGSVESYNATGLTDENEYEWKVVATNANGSSADSNVVSGTTLAQSQGAVTIASADNGSVDFGGGPTVLIFDRFDGGTHGDPISGTRSGDVGQWTSSHTDFNGVPRFYEDRSRSWLCQRDTDLVDTTTMTKVGMFKDFGGAYSEFRFAQRRWVPTDKLFPGASTPGETPVTGSWWKPTWFAGSNGGSLTGEESNDDQADVVFDTFVSGSAFIGGNSVQPEASSGTPGSSLGLFYTDWSSSAPTFTTWYQSGAESAEEAYDASIDLVSVNNDEGKRLTRDDVDTFHKNSDTWAAMQKAYEGMRFGGWIPDVAADESGVAPLLSDCYLAVGSNARACIITSDAATLATSSEAYIVAPDSWSASEVSYTPASRESLGFTHIILADGTLIEDAVTS